MDNLKALSNVIGAVIINLTLGTFYSFGNIVPYVASYMRNNGNPTVTSEHGAWLTAAFLFGQGLSTVLGSFIERYFGSRVAVITGCIIHSGSTFATMLALNQDFPTVIAIYGFGSGFGSGFAYMASIIAAQKWFPTQKGLFTGIIVAGFGFGGLIFTNLQTMYVNPNNIAPDATGYFPVEVYRKVPNLFFYMGLIFALAQSLGVLLAVPPPTSGTAQAEPSRSPGDERNRTFIEEGLPNIRSAFSLFNHQIFYVIAAMMILVAPGVTFVNSLGKRYGQSYISDDKFLATVVALAAIANAGGRLTWGFLVDRFTFSSCFTFKCLLFACLIVLFPFEFILSSKYLYLGWMFGLFFGFSGSFVLFPVFVDQVFGARYSGIAYGILFIGFALASIVTSVLIQSSIGPTLSDPKRGPGDKFLVRLAPCSLIAASYCLSCLIFYICVPVRRVENAIRRRKELETINSQKGLFNRSDLFPLERGSLAEKTIAARSGGRQDIEELDGTKKNNSLGSIVKFTGSGTQEEPKVKSFGSPNAFKVL